MVYEMPSQWYAHRDKVMVEAAVVHGKAACRAGP